MLVAATRERIVHLEVVQVLVVSLRRWGGDGLRSCFLTFLVVQQGAATDADIQAALERINGVMVLGSVLNRYASKLPTFVRRRIPGA